jgi:hypothetical protein
MAISTVTNRVAYQGNGTSAVFAFPYKFRSQTDLGVMIYNSSVVVGGIITPQLLNTDFTISGTQANDGYYPNGANIIFNSTPNAQAVAVIFRSSVVTNDFALSQNGTIPSRSLNNELDYQTLIDQRLQDIVTRAVRVADGFYGTFDPTLPANLASSANKRLIVNSSGTGWTFDQSVGNYIPNTVVVAVTNSTVSSLGGSVSQTFLRSNGSSAPSWNLLVDENSYNQWGVVYASSATKFGIVPTTTVGYVLTSNGSSAPTFQALNIANLVGVLGVLSGGTGTGSAFTRGQLVFAGSSGIYDRSAGMFWDEAGNQLIIGSSLATPSLWSVGTLRSSSLSATPVRASATGLLINGSTALGSEVSGVLPVANGGTNLSSLAPQWGVLFASTSLSAGVLPVGGPGTALISNGSSAPSFQAIAVTNNVATATGTLVTTNANNKVILSSSLYTAFLYKPTGGDAGKEMEFFLNDSSLNGVTIQGSGCAISTIYGAVNSTSMNSLGEATKFFTDGSNWICSIRRYPSNITLAGSSVVSCPAGAAVPIKGSSVTTDMWSYWREDEFLCGRIEFQQITAGAAGGSIYLAQAVPAPLKINTKKILANSSAVTTSLQQSHCGAGMLENSAGSVGNGLCVVHDSSTIKLAAIVGGNGVIWGAGASPFSASDVRVSLSYKVPICGWDG